MSIAALSNAGFSQYVASSSNINASQQALQSLGNSLASGDLTAAQSAFNTYQALVQNLANAGGSTASSSQLSADLTTLGNAIASGDLATSRSAFAAVQADAKATTSPAIAAALAAASQTVTEIEDLLSIFSTNNSAAASSDPVTAILNNTYGSNSSATSAIDPSTALLESHYGANGAGGSSGTSSVNVYA